MFNNLSTENHAEYEIMWKNMVGPDRPHVTIQYGSEKVRFATRITKGKHTDTHSEHVIIIVFPRQQFLR